MLEVRLLGQFEVNKNGERIEIPSRPAQSLLAYLILRTGRAHRREKLAGLLWPDSDEKNARGNLRHAIWRLRQAIGADYIPSDKITVSFETDREYWLDTEVVEREVPSDTDELIGDLTVYGGELLPGFYDDWTVLDRERIRADFERKIQVLMDKLVAEQRWQETSEWGERWIALGHVPEPAYRAMMMAAAGMGDTSGVAAIYRRCEDALRTELGVEPSERTRRVYEELSAGGTPQGLIQEEVPQSAAIGVERMLAGWREQGVEVLDVASLAIVHAVPDGEPFEEANATLLIRSALEHGVDVEPWLDRAPSQLDAIHALVDSYERYPKPKVRRRIVEALAGLQGDAATEALTSIVATEDNPTVRSEAAVAAATNGQVERVVETLRIDLASNGDASALAAFVAVADEVGLPEDVGNYPRLQVGLSLAQRRWSRHRSLIANQTLLSAIGAAGISAIVGSFAPLYAAIWSPDDFRTSMELVSLPAWILVGALVLLIVGGFQGIVSGFSVGIADALWSDRGQRLSRLVLGGLAGLVTGGFLALGTQIAVIQPNVSAGIFIPVLLIYGLLFGATITLAIPSIEVAPNAKDLLKQATLAGLLAGILTVAAATMADVDPSLGPIPRRLVYAIALPVGIALGLTRRRRSDM